MPTGTPGQDTLVGGPSDDTFFFAPANLNLGDVVDGLGNYDTLYFNAAGTVPVANMAGVSNIERIVLFFGSGTVVAFDDVFAANNAAFLFVAGSSGNDTLDASAVTLSSRAIQVTPETGNDTFRGGAGNDAFNFKSTEINAGDIVAGGGGSDTLGIITGGTLTAASLVGVSGIDRIAFGFGANSAISVTIDNAFAAANAATLFVAGSIHQSRNDTFDASAVTLATRSIDVTGGSGADTYRGGAGNDVFRFTDGDFNTYDIVAGGGGYDVFIRAGISIAAAELVGVSGIDEIRLHTLGATASLTLNDAVAAANAVLLVVKGTSAADTVDASAVTLANRGINVVSGVGNDTLRGGAGNDFFSFSASGLTAADLVVGGAGADSLRFDVAGAVSAASLAGVSGIERIMFAVGGVAVTLDDAFAAANAALMTGLGSAGNDTLDASAVTLATRAITVTAGAGNDTLRGGAGNDVFYFYAAELTASDVVGGGGGGDSIGLITAGTVTAASLAGVSGVERFAFSTSVSLTLNDAFAAVNATTLVVAGSSGNDIVDASAVTLTRRAINANGGAGSDTLAGGAAVDTLFGGAGADALSGGGGADRFGWYTVLEGGDAISDFSAGSDSLRFEADVFTTNGALDTLVSGGAAADISLADLFTYTGGPLDDAADVRLLLDGSATAASAGLFVLAENSLGDAVLYYTGDAANSGAAVYAMADLGTTPLPSLQLTDFGFF